MTESLPVIHSPARRRLLGGALLGAALPWGLAQAHGDFGPLRPALAALLLRVQETGGKRVELASLLRGHVTAVQLMFTSCSATCPIQGAIFAGAQKSLLDADPALRLLSLSIDPANDDVAALRAWLARFGANSVRWSAALPQARDVERLFDYLRGRAPGVDRHTAQAFIFDRRARLAYRTEDMPNPDELVRLMQSIAARA